MEERVEEEVVTSDAVLLTGLRAGEEVIEKKTGLLTGSDIQEQ